MLPYRPVRGTRRQTSPPSGPVGGGTRAGRARGGPHGPYRRPWALRLM